MAGVRVRAAFVLLVFALLCLPHVSSAGKNSGDAKSYTSAEEVDEQQNKVESGPTFEEIANNTLRLGAWIFGWAPWLFLYMSAFEGSIVPRPFYQDIFGGLHASPGFDGWLKYIVIPGSMAFYMSVVMLLEQYPEKVHWDSFPAFCVLPRSLWGLLNIHQAIWLHIARLHYAYSSFAIWFIAPTLLSVGKRSFVFCTIFTCFVGHFVYWCIGPPDACIAGLSMTYCGWFGALVVSVLLKCERPIFWGRLVLTFSIGGFIGLRFCDVFWLGKNMSGENWFGYVIGIATGVLFGACHFGIGHKCTKGCVDGNYTFGTFDGYEMEARKIGTPWPGYCAFILRLATFTLGCRRGMMVREAMNDASDAIAEASEATVVELGEMIRKPEALLAHQ